MHELAHCHLNNRRKATWVHLGPGRDPLDDPRVGSDPLKAEPVTWLLSYQSRNQVLRLSGKVGWEPQVNLISSKIYFLLKILEFDHLGYPAVGVIVGLGLKGWFSDKELVGEHSKTPQVNLPVTQLIQFEFHTM